VLGSSEEREKWTSRANAGEGRTFVGYQKLDSIEVNHGGCVYNHFDAPYVWRLQTKI
jgi:hypothetical protein